MVWLLEEEVATASSPFGVIKQVSVQPISFAFLFIREAKASVLPDIFSAIITAESLWDSSIRE